MDPKLITPLSAALELRETAATPHRAFATISPDWAQGRATYGGLVAALCVRALARLKQDRPLRGFSMNFCAPAAPGDVQIDVELLRSGRSLLHAQARLSQDGQTCAVLVGAYGGARPSPVRAEAERPPVIAPPQELQRLPFLQGMTPTFTQHFDYRWASQNIPFSRAAHGQIGGWVRPLGVDRIDDAVCAAIADSFPAPILPMMPAPAPSSTVTWMLNFTSDPVEIPASSYWQLDATTLSASEGYAHVEARLWDATGVLRMLSRQLVAEFSAP
jgi:acyl-CoA thioesterase